MRSKIRSLVVWFTLVSSPLLLAAGSPKQPKTLEEQVRHELAMLPYYTVFDSLSFQVDGGRVVLSGKVTRPTLKNEAANVVRKIEGVQGVENKVEVLPLSPADSDIRLELYHQIYSESSFTRYAIQAVPPIHIVVENGHVTLVGKVGSEADKNLAYIRAMEVPGVFTVENQLEVDSKG